ncbi:MAG: ribbon-helix-helix domain-containing protein [Bifidobacteriaceae bacterium]|jgi:hypothetical protein|nr:ribbon-helix-helix domain-containing protein [Bifidobacteriaceae bacterium]
MLRTTVYLPDDLKRRVEGAASARGVAEAQVIREALDQGLPPARPRPSLGLYASGDPLSDRVDEILAEGFGAS